MDLYNYNKIKSNKGNQAIAYKISCSSYCPKVTDRSWKENLRIMEKFIRTLRDISLENPWTKV